MSRLGMRLWFMLRLLLRLLGLLLLRLHLLLQFGRQRNSFGYGCLFSGATLAARCGVDKHFNVWVVGCRSRRRGNIMFKYGVKVSGEVVAARVYVDGRVKGSDVNGLFDTPFYPVMF